MSGMGPDYISTLDKEARLFDVSASFGGVPWAPGVGATVEGAWTVGQADPVGGDWVAGTFETTRIGTVIGAVLIGPGSTKTLAPGRYTEWVRVTDPVSGETPVKPVGVLIVQ